jgi:hypothetical protein
MMMNISTFSLQLPAAPEGQGTEGRGRDVRELLPFPEAARISRSTKRSNL